MLVHRLRRCLNNKPALGQRPVFAGMTFVLVQDCPNVDPAELTSQQTRHVDPIILRRWANISPALDQRVVFAGIKS